MKKSTLKYLQMLAQEHAKLKATILEMCETLDTVKDLKDKETIKVAVDKSIEKLHEIEDAYQIALDSIPPI